MSDFGETAHPLARKRHRCELCYWPIFKGERHAQFKGMFDGGWQNWRAHEECYAEYMADSPEDGFLPGEWPVPDAVRQRHTADQERA